MTTGETCGGNPLELPDHGQSPGQEIFESRPDPELASPFKPVLELAVEGFDRTAANGTALLMDFLVL